MMFVETTADSCVRFKRCSLLPAWWT